MGSTELVEHGPVQTVVDGVEGQTLGTPLRLEEGEEEVRGGEKREKYAGGIRCVGWLLHRCGLDLDEAFGKTSAGRFV